MSVYPQSIGNPKKPYESLPISKPRMGRNILRGELPSIQCRIFSWHSDLGCKSLVILIENTHINDPFSKGFSVFSLSLFSFFGLHVWHMEVSGTGMNPSCSCDLHHSCGNARSGSLVHPTGLGFETEPLWDNTGSLSCCTRGEMPQCSLCKVFSFLILLFLI